MKKSVSSFMKMFYNPIFQDEYWNETDSSGQSSDSLVPVSIDTLDNEPISYIVDLSIRSPL